MTDPKQVTLVRPAGGWIVAGFEMGCGFMLFGIVLSMLITVAMIALGGFGLVAGAGL
jgi:hypothetical protein